MTKDDRRREERSLFLGAIMGNPGNRCLAIAGNLINFNVNKYGRRDSRLPPRGEYSTSLLNM